MDFYDQNAATYASSSCAHDLGFLIDPFCDRIPATGRILDLGSGAGRDSLAMARRGLQVVSLDRSRGMLREHQSRGGGALVQADLSWLPFRPQAFDGIWACASFLHVPKARLVFALTEAGRVLRPEGILFVSLKLGEGESTDPEGRWWSFYQEDELVERLALAGFGLIEKSRTPDLAGRGVEWVNLLASRG